MATTTSAVPAATSAPQTVQLVPFQEVFKDKNLLELFLRLTAIWKRVDVPLHNYSCVSVSQFSRQEILIWNVTKEQIEETDGWPRRTPDPVITCTGNTLFVNPQSPYEEGAWLILSEYKKHKILPEEKPNKDRVTVDKTTYSYEIASQNIHSIQDIKITQARIQKKSASDKDDGKTATDTTKQLPDAAKTLTTSTSTSTSQTVQLVPFQDVFKDDKLLDLLFRMTNAWKKINVNVQSYSRVSANLSHMSKLVLIWDVKSEDIKKTDGWPRRTPPAETTCTSTTLYVDPQSCYQERAWLILSEFKKHEILTETEEFGDRITVEKTSYSYEIAAHDINSNEDIKIKDALVRKKPASGKDEARGMKTGFDKDGLFSEAYT